MKGCVIYKSYKTTSSNIFLLNVIFGDLLIFVVGADCGVSSDGYALACSEGYHCCSEEDHTCCKDGTVCMGKACLGWKLVDVS